MGSRKVNHFDKIESVRLPRILPSGVARKPSNSSLTQPARYSRGKPSLNPNSFSLPQLAKTSYTASSSKTKSLDLSQLVEHCKKAKENELEKLAMRQSIKQLSYSNSRFTDLPKRISTKPEQRQNQRHKKISISQRLPPLYLKSEADTVASLENTKGIDGLLSNSITAENSNSSVKQDQLVPLDEQPGDGVSPQNNDNTTEEAPSDATPPKVRVRRFIRLSEVNSKKRRNGRERPKNKFNFDFTNFDPRRAMLSSSATLRGLKILNASEVVIYRFRLSNYNVRDINTIVDEV